MASQPIPSPPARSWWRPLLVWGALGAALAEIEFVVGAFGLVSPWVPPALVGLAFALYVLGGGGRTRSGVVVSVAASLALVLLLSRWPNGLRRDFVQAARAIQPGMQLEQADALMADFQRGHPYGEVIGASFPGWTFWHSGDEQWDYDHCRVRCGDRGEVRAIELVLD
jgi:hypothetical protein